MKHFTLVETHTGAEVGQFRTLQRAVEAMRRHARLSGPGLYRIDQDGAQVGPDLVQFVADHLDRLEEPVRAWELRNYWFGQRLGTYATREAAEAAWREQIALSPANRINCGVEGVR